MVSRGGIVRHMRRCRYLHSTVPQARRPVQPRRAEPMRCARLSTDARALVWASPAFGSSAVAGPKTHAGGPGPEC
jgi:hypothetical protein